jgi:protein kinase X
MIFGYSPFYSYGMGKLKLYERIVAAHYSFPCKIVSIEAKDLISKILVADNSRRLGSLVGGDDDIRYHPWLAKLSESEMTKKCVEAPVLPTLKFHTEVHGKHEKDEWEFIETVNRTNKLTRSQQLLFKDF